MNRLFPRLWIFQRALACIALAHCCAHAATFVVTSTADSGKGSLREAILDANSSPGPDVIAFSIPGGGEQVITLASELPPILDTVTIDGYTQPAASRNTRDRGWDARVNIFVDGSAVAPPGTVFTETYGLTFRRGAAGSVLSGVKVSGFTHGVVLANVDRVTVEGSKVLGNGLVQILATGNANAIGVAGAQGRNLVAGRGTGIHLVGERNTVHNNYIGFTESIGEGAGVDSGLNGVVAWFGKVGVVYASAAVSGADLVCSKGQCGLAFKSNRHEIGGLEKGAGNVIVGQALDGVVSRGSSRDDKFNAIMQVHGNVFGASFDGTRARAFGNSYGVYLNHVGPSAIGIQDNAFFDGEVGIVVNGGSSPVTGVRIARNRIAGHHGMAIDLGENGRDTNDGQDLDGGDNNGQNWPSFTSRPSGNVWRLEGAPSQPFTLEFFQSATCRKPEADVFLGAFRVTSDVNGFATFTGPPGALPGGFITATATDRAGNTSELSECSAAPRLKSKVEIVSAKSGLMSGSFDSRFEMRVDGGGVLAPSGTVDLWFVDASGARTQWIGSASLSGNTAIWTNPNLVQGQVPLANTPGAFRVQAEYVGDYTFESSTSNVVDYRVYDVRHTFTDAGVSDLLRANLAAAVPDTFEILAGSDVRRGVTHTWNSVGLAPGKRIVAAGKFVRGFGQASYLVADPAGNMTVENHAGPGAPLAVRPITGWVGGAVVGIGRFFDSHQQGIVVDRAFMYHEALLLPDTYGATLPLVRRVQLEPAPRPSGITSLTMAAVGDFNGDGHDDIIWEVNGALELQLMSGATRLGPPAAVTPLVLSVGGVPVVFSLAGVGDFDGDGRTDLAWAGGDSYYVMLMDGNMPKEPIDASRVLPIGADWAIQAIADYDGDGKADLLWRSEVQGLNLITYMEGSRPPSRQLSVQAFLPPTTGFIDP